MSYTPTTWTTGDTITATALNKIEQGIAGAGGGGGGVVVVYCLATGVYGIDGDFASSLEKVQNGIPLAAIYCQGSSGSWGFSVIYPTLMGTGYSESDPNTITLYMGSTEGFYWTENGIEHFS